MVDISAQIGSRATHITESVSKPFFNLVRMLGLYPKIQKV